MIDLPQADTVEVSVSHAHDGARIWVNVNGRCALRAYRVDRFYYDGEQVFATKEEGEHQ